MLPDITLDPLASTRKMCDADYFLVFDAEEVRIYDARTTNIVASKPPVLKGWRDKTSTLWRIPLVNRAPAPDLGPKANRTPGTRPASSDAQKPFSPIFRVLSETISNVYQLRTKPEVIRYLHAAAGFPTEATWHGAVKNGNYASWPWMNPKNVRAHFPESEETQKGYLKNQRQGYRSTTRPAKRRPRIDVANVDTPVCPPVVADAKHQDMFMCTIDLKDEIQAKIYKRMKDRIYTDQTGKFPVQSSRGHPYIMVLINMDSFYISMEPLKTRHASQLVKTYQIMIDRLKACEINPKKTRAQQQVLCGVQGGHQG